LNRIDDVIVFNTLEKEDLAKIIRIELTALFARMEGLGYPLTLSDSAIDFLAERGFDPKFGARPLARSIQKYVEDPLAEAIVSGQVHAGDSVHMDGPNEAGDALLYSVHPAVKLVDQPSEKKESKNSKGLNAAPKTEEPD
jgi:ATP-dependent Clp protease ATP-binding subunit ClpC